MKGIVLVALMFELHLSVTCLTLGLMLLQAGCLRDEHYTVLSVHSELNQHRHV